ncbi:MAG: Lon protease family protein [Cellulosilyticaceae bacterium]
MKRNIEVKWHELKYSYQPSDFSFTTTDDLTPIEEPIGQEGAIKALEFALKLNSKGYNIYVSGEEGLGLSRYIKRVINQVASGKDIPNDICYICNLKEQTEPKVLLMHPGDGIKFKDDMKEFTQFLIDELTGKLDSQEADKKRQKVIEELDDKKNEMMEQLQVTAKKLGFVLKLTKEGIGFIPLDSKNQPLTEEAYGKLDKQEKKQMKVSLNKLQTIAEDMVEALRDTEKIYAEYLDDINEEIVLREIGVYIKRLKEKYGIYNTISLFLDEISHDIIENIILFAHEETEEEKGVKALFPWVAQKGISDLVERYSINLVVDNSNLKYAPVIVGSNLSYGNLVGKLRIEGDLNAARIDFNSIVAGLFHKANGGYLILDANEVFTCPGAWEAIKRMVKTGYIHTENLQSVSIATTIGLVPEPIQANIKVVLVGPYNIYGLVKDVDPEFKELFKLNVDFDMILDSDKEMIYNLACKIKQICDEEKLLPVSIEGILKLVECSSRGAGSQDKLTADISPLLNLVREANVVANTIITNKDIESVLEIKELLKKKVEKHVLENYDKHILMIDLSGKKTGQINGLAVSKIDEYSFGQPIRITATTYRGKTGVIDVEKAAGLSGNIHTKGIEIIEGILGHQFAQEIPLSLCCRICVEQNYGGIDGDSASSAELYAILSSLAEVPIRQSLAVTGSINQYGKIQPIGGVNEKIEGFYRACAERGLTGKQGVIIPYQNKGDLVLNDEVIEAVKNNMFHIYQVDDFTQGIELLTGYSYQEIESRIMKKLKGFNKGTKTSKIK